MIHLKWIFVYGVKWRLRIIAAAAAKSLQSCPTLWDPIDGSPPGSPIPGIFQARTLEWTAISFSNAWKWKVKSEIEVVQSCPTLSNPMDFSLPGSSASGIFQAKVLEWGTIAFSKDHWAYINIKLLKYHLKMIFPLLNCLCQKSFDSVYDSVSRFYFFPSICSSIYANTILS